MQNIAKVQIICGVGSRVKVLWYESIEWNMEENFSMEWNIFSLEKDGKKLLEWKNHLLFHTINHVLAVSNLCNSAK